MLINWLLTISLAAGITLSAIQAFLDLSKYYNVLVAISEEQSQIRFLVSYFRSILHVAVEKTQFCGGIINQNNALIAVSGSKDLILEVLVCQLEASHSVIVPMRFFLMRNEKHTDVTLFVQQGDHRRELLSKGLHSFSLNFCVQTSPGITCQPATAIQDWSRVVAVNFDLQFQSNPLVDTLAKLKNDHRWHYTIKIGAHK